MSLMLAQWPIRWRTGHVLLSAVAVFGVAMVVFGLSISLWLSMAALAVSGAPDMISGVIRSTSVQLKTPDEERGRVSAVNSVFIGASNQLGELESGATAAAGAGRFGVLGGIGTLLVAGRWLGLFPALARRDALVHGQAEGHAEGHAERVPPSRHRAAVCQRRPSSVSRALAALLRTFHCACCAFRSSIVIVSRRASRCSF